MNIDTLKDWLPVGGLIVAAYTIWATQRSSARARLEQARWELIREACLEALEVVDAVFSHQTFTHPTGERVEVCPQNVDVAKARAAMNKLALACKDRLIIEAFGSAIGLRGVGEERKAISIESIDRLRGAIRRELGFAKVHLEIDRNKTWIANIGPRRHEGSVEAFQASSIDVDINS